MFVKVYQYHIQKDKVEEYLDIQEKTLEIYSRYLDLHTIYLNSKVDDTKWMEIIRYKDEDEYKRSINIINEKKEIQELFESFQSLLVTDNNKIREEDFIET
ncbi:hypothetical protein CV093_04100 [Oceanobacillus sp. 143]|uniref:ABM domain-containing protein n=1 Tax=Oceanobacillus zhaokaii TaxID=2052660 RepID=A0A345PDT8_9BACI|nr:hypothetical protein [Oceanobacillus zhaokaii]AXI08168.1 hypothetical protein CUC15_03960 [Oceanobacillus zhaokaii]QGS68115.1 hypothetical protein CV093_04100 [Oceanobacillus sp. 143]